MAPPAGPLAGRIALVTGASRGIGRASALALAGAGARMGRPPREQPGMLPAPTRLGPLRTRPLEGAELAL